MFFAMLVNAYNALVPLYILTNNGNGEEWTKIRDIKGDTTFVVYDDKLAVRQYEGVWLKWPELELGGWDYVHYIEEMSSKDGVEQVELIVVAITANDFTKLVDLSN